MKEDLKYVLIKCGEQCAVDIGALQILKLHVENLDIKNWVKLTLCNTVLTQECMYRWHLWEWYLWSW